MILDAGLFELQNNLFFMTQKCLKCGAPISGFLSKIAWFAGVKPSKIKSGYCNKCENEVLGTEATGRLVTESERPVASVLPVVPEQTPVAQPVEKPIPSAPVKDIFDDLEKK
mgnify:CR=1 FL=1